MSIAFQELQFDIKGEPGSPTKESEYYEFDSPIRDATILLKGFKVAYSDSDHEIQDLMVSGEGPTMTEGFGVVTVRGTLLLQDTNKFVVAYLISFDVDSTEAEWANKGATIVEITTGLPGGTIPTYTTVDREFEGWVKLLIIADLED